MILIFSEKSDFSTKHVLHYLNYFDQTFELFLEKDVIEFHYYIDNYSYKYKVYKNNVFLCNDDDIKSVWYRRCDIQVQSLGIGILEDENEIDYAKGHVKTRSEQIERSLQMKKCLGYFGKANFNKIEFLEKCVLLGINIPKTLISKSKVELLNFLSECKNKVITKSLNLVYLNVFFEDEIESKWKIGFTAEIDPDKTHRLPERFDLSLFQEKLDKKFEIRVFYIAGKCFSEIILSQAKIESSLDYRTGYESGMRQCNYTLPNNIEDQVCLLMESLGLNTGSLDIVVTKENQYVFLEVNPSGQFGDVSEKTNSNLEYEIANFLIN